MWQFYDNERKCTACQRCWHMWWRYQPTHWTEKIMSNNDRNWQLADDVGPCGEDLSKPFTILKRVRCPYRRQTNGTKANYLQYQQQVSKVSTNATNTTSEHLYQANWSNASSPLKSCTYCSRLRYGWNRIKQQSCNIRNTYIVIDHPCYLLAYCTLWPWTSKLGV